MWPDIYIPLKPTKARRLEGIDLFCASFSLRGEYFNATNADIVLLSRSLRSANGNNELGWAIRISNFAAARFSEGWLARALKTNVDRDHETFVSLRDNSNTSWLI